MPKQSIGPIAVAQQFIISAFGVSATILGAKMIGAEISMWLWIIIVIIFGFVGIFLSKIANWLTNLYQSKKLRYLIWAVLLFIFITWLGWPWTRIQNTFADIMLRHPLITEKWISEKDAEQFIINKLRREGNQEVFERRVRYLLKWEADRYIIGRFKCPEDSIWHNLHRNEFDEIPAFRNYDGTEPLSEFTGCRVEFLTEHIYMTDWVEKNKTKSIRLPNPNS